MGAMIPRAPVVQPSVYTLPTASDLVLGGVLVGTSLEIDGGGILDLHADLLAKVNNPRVELLPSLEAASFTLSGTHWGKILLVSGDDVNITLPEASTITEGFFCTVYNDNASNSPVAHSSSPANTPFGKKIIRFLRSGSDLVNGTDTDILGAATFLGPRIAVDIIKGASGKWIICNSDRVGWKDLVADPHTHGAGTADPTEATVSTSFYKALAFSGAGVQIKEVQASFHINHDYMMGTRVYPHTHWTAGNTTNAIDAVKWSMQYSVAKGHQQQAFFTEAGGGTTKSVTQTLTGTPYMHYVSELSDADAIVPDNCEPDSLILVRFYRDPADVADTFTSDVWLLTVDCHYLADRFATPLKAPPFFL